VVLDELRISSVGIKQGLQVFSSKLIQLSGTDSQDNDESLDSDYFDVEDGINVANLEDYLELESVQGLHLGVSRRGDDNGAMHDASALSTHENLHEIAIWITLHRQDIH
jgi:hypothetical protein